jgi:hypothetical protein
MLRDYAERAWRWLTRRKHPPFDPFSSVRQPVRRGPPSRNAGVALAEPTRRRSINLLVPFLGSSAVHTPGASGGTRADRGAAPLSSRAQRTFPTDSSSDCVK